METEGPNKAHPEETIAKGALVLSGLGLVAMGFTMGWHLSLAALFGASSRLDAFWAAYAIPKALVDSLYLGVLSLVFVLVWRHSPSVEERSRLASAFVNITLLITAGVILIMSAGAEALVRINGPGLSASDSALSAGMLRWLTLMVLPSALAGIVGAALYAEGRFAAFSWARVVAPLVQVAVLLILAPQLGEGAPVWAALAGPAAMGIVCVFLVKRLPFTYTLTLQVPGHEARLALRVFLVLCAFALLERANQTTDRFFATLVGPGALSVLEFSWRLEIPISQLLSLAVGLPTFVLMAHVGGVEKLADMRSIVSASLRLISLFVVPSIGFLVVLRQPIIELLFLRGAFTDQSAALLIALVPALGVIFTVRAFGVVLVLGSLAIDRTTRLLVVLAMEVAVNTALNFLVYERFGLWGVVSATALAMTVSNLYLWRTFARALDWPAWSSLPRLLARPVAASATSLVLLAGSYALVAGALQQLHVPAGILVLGFAVAFGATHLAVTRGFGELDVSLRRRRVRILVTPAASVDKSAR